MENPSTPLEKERLKNYSKIAKFESNTSLASEKV